METARPVRLSILAGIVILFVVIGPPIGAMAFSIIGATGALATGQPPGTAGMIFYGGLLGIALSWFVGGLQALASGIAMAAYAAARRRLSLLIPTVAGAMTGIIYQFEEGPAGAFGLLLIATHAVAALACAVLAKQTWKL